MANLESLMDRLQASKQLINMDNNGQIDKIKENAEKTGKISYNRGDTSDDNFSINIAQSKQLNEQVRQVPVTQQSIAKSKLPKEILESFSQKPAIVNTANPFSTEGSVLEQLDNITKGKLYKNMEKEVKQNLRENVTYAQPSTTPNASSNIDYSMIKMIVEESMKKYVSTIKKTIINESKNTVSESSSTLQAMKIGEKFSFIDGEGNLYEAKLKFIKNIKDK